jgi:hypothetical protein
MFAAMRRGSIGLSPLLMQLKQKRLCEGLGAEHTVFDRPPRCAAISCSYGDYAIPHDIPTGYALPLWRLGC